MTPRILFVGPLLDYSGYAAAARNYVRALDPLAYVVTRDLRYDSGGYKRTSREEELSGRTATDVNIVIQMTTPNEMSRKEGKFNVGIFCWETDKIPPQWVSALNSMDLVIVPCEANATTIRQCGIVVPVVKVPFSTDTQRFKQPQEPLELNQFSEHFKFLSIFQFAKKKAFDVLIKAYLSEFGPDENVLLISKVYFGFNDGEAERQRLLELVGAMKEMLRLKNYPRVLLLHKISSFEEIDKLYATADCYVLPSRGEGWGVPHLDALGFGLPAIATKGTGPEEFITPTCGWLVDSHDSPVLDMPHPFDFLYTAKENWREPHVGHLRRCMREAYEKWKMCEVNPIWDNMRATAKNRASDFSNEKIGPLLFSTILDYYRMAK